MNMCLNGELDKNTFSFRKIPTLLQIISREIEKTRKCAKEVVNKNPTHSQPATYTQKTKANFQKNLAIPLKSRPV